MMTVIFLLTAGLLLAVFSNLDMTLDNAVLFFTALLLLTAVAGGVLVQRTRQRRHQKIWGDEPAQPRHTGSRSGKHANHLHWLMGSAGVVGVVLAVWLTRHPFRSDSDARMATPATAASTPDLAPTQRPDTAAHTSTAVDGVDGIDAVIQHWAQAWASGEVAAYLSHYSPSFTPAPGVSHEAWVAQRRQRVDAARRITIGVEALSVRPLGPNQAEVQFVQRYAAQGLQDVSRKTLVLEQANGGWVIVSESAETLTALPSPPD
jgi:hypothetical protein